MDVVLFIYCFVIVFPSRGHLGLFASFFIGARVHDRLNDVSVKRMLGFMGLFSLICLWPPLIFGLFCSERMEFGRDMDGHCHKSFPCFTRDCISSLVDALVLPDQRLFFQR